MYRRFIVIITIILALLGGMEDIFSQTIVYDYETLVNNKKVLKSNKSVQKLVKSVLNDADQLLKKPGWTITKKTKLPASGDKHDYLSHAPYWWPNPKTSNGLPYVQKDGQNNPSRLEIKDLSYLIELSKSVRTLGLAYYFSGDKKYALQAEKFLKIWFLNGETKMNPNFNYAQAVPGRADGRAQGIIDSRYFIELIDGMILAKSGFVDNTYSEVVAWFDEFNRWMGESPIGIEASKLTNNIGTSYYLQRLVYLRLTNDNQQCKKIIENDVTPLLGVQFDSDGSQIFEKKRTKSWNYSVVNLKYWFNIAKIADDVDIDLFNFQTPNGKNLENGYKYLEGVANGDREWLTQQISKIDYSQSFSPLGFIGAKKYKTGSNSTKKLSTNDAYLLLTENKF